MIDNKTIQLAKRFNKQKELYPEIVEKLIRAKYTISQELAIHRQRETKPDEFAEYNSYCESCKTKAKELLGI